MAFLDREGLQKVWAHMNSQIYKKAEKNKEELTLYLIDELAKRNQLSPEFANSVEECADQSKLYVLPDGYIYAYMYTEVAAEGSNNNLAVPKISTDTSDPDAWLEGYRFSTSSISTQSGGVITNRIPCKLGDTIYIKGLNVNVQLGSSYARIRPYNGDSVVNIGSLDAKGIIDNGYGTVNGDLITLRMVAEADPDYNMSSNAFDSVRLNGSYISGYTADTVKITVNEEYKETTGETIKEYAWTNTGHAFVPADNENRVIALENDVAKAKEQTATLDKRVTSLEESTDESIPTYVLTEAERVADNILSVRTANSFVLAGASDLHTTGSDISSVSVLHAGQAMDAINDYTTIDLVALFGDIIVDRFTDTYKDGFKHVKRSFSEIYKAVPHIQLQGNHDELNTDTTEQAQQKYYAYIGANNVGVITDYENKYRNYGYRDFDNYKIRVIYVNTADVSAADITGDTHMTAEQCEWLVNVAFDLSSKDDAAEWGIIVLSHHPLNWYGAATTCLLPLLDAFKGRASGTLSNGVAYDFTTAKAEMICHLHGHMHNYRAETLGTTKILTMTVPNACYYRNNEYGTHSAYSEEVHTTYGDPIDDTQPWSVDNQYQYNKTSNTEKDTAFCVFVIDRDSKRIYAYHYGAGRSRFWNYETGTKFADDQTITTYTITVNATNCSAATSNAATIEQGGTASLTFTANENYTLPATVSITGATYTWNAETGVLVLSDPTANVVATITATAATVEPETPAYTNLVKTATDATGAVFNGTGYMTGKRWSSSSVGFSTYKDSESSRQVLIGMIPFKMGQTLRVKNGAFTSSYSSTNAFKTFAADRSNLATGYLPFRTAATQYPAEFVISDDETSLTFNPTTAYSSHITANMEYIAMTILPKDGAENVIITVDEEIV